jgi:hypothetical protein
MNYNYENCEIISFIIKIILNKSKKSTPETEPARVPGDFYLSLKCGNFTTFFVKLYGFC